MLIIANVSHFPAVSKLCTVDYTIEEGRLRQLGRKCSSKAGAEYIALDYTLQVGVAASGLDFAVILENGESLGTTSVLFGEDD